eukprot:4789835-Amphidinium_carterae.2
MGMELLGGLDANAVAHGSRRPLSSVQHSLASQFLEALQQFYDDRPHLSFGTNLWYGRNASPRLVECHPTSFSNPSRQTIALCSPVGCNSFSCLGELPPHLMRRAQYAQSRALFIQGSKILKTSM